MSFTPDQCRAGRALIAWSQTDLAEKSRISVKTIADFEAGNRRPYDHTLEYLQRALERGGCIFIDSNGEGPGVRLSKKKAESDTAARAGAAARALKARGD